MRSELSIFIINPLDIQVKSIFLIINPLKIQKESCANAFCNAEHFIYSKSNDNSWQQRTFISFHVLQNVIFSALISTRMITTTPIRSVLLSLLCLSRHEICNIIEFPQLKTDALQKKIIFKGVL